MVGRRDVVGRPLLEALPELVGQGFDTLLHIVHDVQGDFHAVVRPTPGAPST